MVPINQDRRKSELASAIAQNPQEFTWDGDTYSGRFSNTRAFTMTPVEGGMVNEYDAALWCLRESFTSGLPSEGDILRVRGVGYRIQRVVLAMDYGVKFELESPERRQ